MSSEKEIVNYWYNKQGYFTISNIKTQGNKDAGILAVRISSGAANDVLHVGVACSITSNIGEAKSPKHSIKGIIDNKFNDESINEAISIYLKQFSIQGADIKKFIVLGSLSKSRKSEITREFNQIGIGVIEFEDVLYDVLENLDTSYYKNSIIRTLQLTKFLLLSQPSKLANLVLNQDFGSVSRKEFLSNILERDEIIRDLRKTKAVKIGAILKSSGLRPEELAELIEREVLNNKTKRLFFMSLLESESARKIINEAMATGIKPRPTKDDISLERFF